MNKLTQIIGALLILTGVIFYLVTMSSVTALIPAFFGLLIFLCGWIGARRPAWNRHAMHAAAALALIAILGSVMPAFSSLAAGTGLTAAVVEQLLTIILCLVLLVMAVRSFIAARRTAE